MVPDSLAFSSVYMQFGRPVCTTLISLSGLSIVWTSTDKRWGRKLECSKFTCHYHAARQVPSRAVRSLSTDTYRDNLHFGSISLTTLT
ncbi:hypothetical protein K474DRAFT_1662217 [Panus rudis PR-1116 ss-1]|nr:hypothetical protein K474DRAFT_1662217 [Panus rudis PR-1116 ss-1]